jgi:TonB family protein
MALSANVLEYLASVAARSLVLAGAAALALVVLRVKSAAGRHAVWTAVMLGMLLLAVMEPVLPPLPIRVLRAVETAPLQLPDAPVAAGETPAASRSVGRPNGLPHLGWRDAAAAAWLLGALILLARLGVSYLFTRRLLRAARPIERPWAQGIFESGWISVPMTAGRRILLPAGWEAWDASKLRAVLAHERTHLRRGDWGIALAAAVNRAVFWFHPLAWWLSRQLASLAEQACDDAALLEVPGAPYAQALLEMAAAAGTAQGRLMWEAMAMAKKAEVTMRIERVLDETRPIPRAWTPRRWLALAACGLPLVWLAAVTQLAPAIAQEQPKTPAEMSQYLKSRQISPGDVAALENYLAANPNDIETRAQLIMYYYANGVREPRLSHIFWLIQNHPESSAALFTSRGITPRDSSYNTAADYQRALGLWRQAGQGDNPAAIRNSAEFLGSHESFDEAEQLLQRAKSLQPWDASWDQALGKLYATAILSATGDSKFARANASPAFANRVQAELEQSNNRPLVMAAATALVFAARHPQPGQMMPQGTLNLDEHPALAPAVELGQRLLDRMGVRMFIGPTPNAAAAYRVAPPVVHKVDPVYPQMAMAARISGVVNFRVTIATDGTVRHIEVISGHPLLVMNAMDALKQWTFQPPATQGDYTVDINFDLGTVSPEAIQAARDSVGTPTSRKQASGPGLPDTIKIGPRVQASKLEHKVDPIYPPQARADGIQGDVTVQVTIKEDGTVASAEAIDGNPVLAGAAVDAVKQYTYKPTLLNGNPVKVVTTVIVPFQP